MRIYVIRIHFVGRRIMLALAALVILAWAAPQQADALSCAGPDASRSVESSDVVLVGTPILIDGIYGEVAVERYLKGSGPDTVRIKSVMASWGGFWDQGSARQRWIFFLDREMGDSRADYLEWACSGSGPVGAEWMGTLYEDVLAITGEGVLSEGAMRYTVVAAAQEGERVGMDGTVGFVVAGVIGIGAFVGLLIMKRRGWMG